MASCLGLYVEKNLIKYAKVSKNNNDTKVESFGIKFYEDIEEAIKQIIDETYSSKIPISLNLYGEQYNQFEVFSMLSSKDIDGLIKTEFETLCYEKGENKNLYEQRYVLSSSKDKGEKLKVIHVSAQKTNIEQVKNQFKKYRLSSVLPIGLTIPNLINSKEINVIVNIEKNTTITKVLGNTIIDVEVLPFGSQDILEKIKQKENSYLKAYEICKNTTIYTENDKDLQYEENVYLDDIMPTLFEIVSETRSVVNESFDKVNKVYITGTMSVINNIDIYFQEYLKDTTCEILKPSFIGNNSKVNIKDYIEVNSAISLAIKNFEKNNMNFVAESNVEKVFKNLNKDVSLKGVTNQNLSISEILEKYERAYNVLVFTVVFITISYVFGINYLTKEIEEKAKLASISIEKTNNQIKMIEEKSKRFSDQKEEYERMISNIQSINNANSENKRYKNTIPNLLNNIMAIIPKQVQLVSIENNWKKEIIVVAKSAKYEQLAFLKTKLKTEGILTNVVSDSGVMNSGYITVTIKGELP